MLEGIMAIALGATACLLAAPQARGADVIRERLSKHRAVFSGHLRARGSALGAQGVALVTGAGLTAGIATLVFTTSLLFALVAAIASGTLTARARAGTQKRAARIAALNAWPDLLAETELRVASLGSPLPLAFFAASRGVEERLRSSFAAAERSFAITGSFESALGELAANIDDGGTRYACELMSVVSAAPGGEVARLLNTLRADMAAERERTLEYSSRLAGLRFARMFVFIVPLGMTLAGAGIAGISAYRNSAGRAGIAFSALILTICWLWAARLGRPPSSYPEPAQ